MCCDAVACVVNSSVLENYHVSTAFTHTLRYPEMNIFRNLDKYSFETVYSV